MDVPGEIITAAPADAAPDGAASAFRARELDDDPALLDESYRLRYQVFCIERQFLSPTFFPDGREIDVFDKHSVHLGVLDAQDRLVATARLVRRTEDGLPMYGHCSLLVREPVLADFFAPLVEISRLAVSRKYNRRRGDQHYGLEGGSSANLGGDRREGGEIVMTLYREVYQASKRHGFTHWLAATERSLQRLLIRYRLPFTQVGPETDYYGMVAPYLLDLTVLDREVLAGQVPAIRDWLVGLDPRFHPSLSDA
jgi:N-acyl amino acid synthase of PEP-CTERM/exosortase system